MIKKEKKKILFIIVVIIILIFILFFNNSSKNLKLDDPINDLDNIEIEHLEKEVIKKEDIINDNGLLFSITFKKKKCVPIQLNIYEDKKYILYNSYKACKPNKTCNLMLTYSKSINGTYKYDIMKIINNSQTNNYTNNKYRYEIFTGNGQIFITDNNNKYLKEFLKQININLDQCAKPDYN